MVGVMLACDLVKKLPCASVNGDVQRDVADICYDSRQVHAGTLFVALRGRLTDGHNFLQEAVSSGAAALLVEDPQAKAFADRSVVICVPDSRRAMAVVAAEYYNHPSRDLLVFGVTGTNGKTTVTHLIESIYRAAGYNAGIIGTLGAKIGDSWTPVLHTTPESCDLQDLLARIRDAGVKAVAMEIRSHAIVQNRVDALELDAAIFTNLTQDHLDFHETMENYFQAKAELFTRFCDETGKDFVSVINIDDPVGRERLLPVAKGQVVTYGAAPDADYHASDPRSGPKETCFYLECPQGSRKIRLALGGFFNVYNALAASAACLAKGIPLDAVQRGLETVPNVPGRFEAVDCGQPFTVLVDYAHTPDGLKNVLSSSRSLQPSRIITVFGCGGDRDRSKRPLMGKIASDLSDICILTSDNPRSEDPGSIARDTLAGIPKKRQSEVIVRLDRREAIREACAMAREGDIVVVAGKGHETYQIFADKTINFDDRLEVRETLKELGLVIMKKAGC